MLFCVGVIIYDALTGRVSGRGAYIRLKEHPILFWILTPIQLCIGVLLLWLVIHDFYRRFTI